VLPLKPSAKSLWIGLTDLRKIFRERRTLGLIIVLPVIVVIVVGTTFNLGYQQFESKELFIGVVQHRNSSYGAILVEAIEDQNAQARLYQDVEEARKDLVREKIDSIIEVDPWIDEKMVEFKRSWIRIHTDETRPILTAAIEVTMVQAKQDVVDDLVGEYVQHLQEALIPALDETLARLEEMTGSGELDEKVGEILTILGSIAELEDTDVYSMARIIDEGIQDIVENGTLQEKILVSMVNRSAIVGSLRSLAEVKPILDSVYHFLRYVEPHLHDLDSLPAALVEDMSSFTGNISSIGHDQATLIQAALPVLRSRIEDALVAENPSWPGERVEDTTTSLIVGTQSLMGVLKERGSEIDNMTEALDGMRNQIESISVNELMSEARQTLGYLENMESNFITSPIYLAGKPLYFGDETKRYVDYISPGIFAFGILFSVLVYTVLSVVRDREKGILRRLFTCNVNRWSYVGSKCLTCMVIAAIQIVILTVCAILLFDIYVADVPKTIILGLYSSVGFVGLGLLISSVTKTELEAVTASFGIVFIMLMISGVFYPFELSPSIIRQASAYVPVTYVANLLKAGIIKDAGLQEMAMDVISVGLYGGATLLAGAIAFRWRKKD
jgi:ABC-type multidrug transport system permease subunit